MAHRNRFGVDQPVGFAGALVAAMTADGVDPTEPGAIDRWMAEFNSRPYDERAAVLSDVLVGGLVGGLTGGPSAVRAVEVPDEDLARTSAAECILLAKARLLVDFVGEGRKLTQTGNVTLADARHLVTLLDTGDRFDEKVGDRTFKTHSAADLPQLGFIVRVATKARFVRSVKGKLLATKAGRDLGRDPLADLCRLVEAIDGLGLVTARTAGGRFIWSTLAPFFDDLFVPLTVLLLTAPYHVAFTEIVEHAFEQFEQEVDLDNAHWNESRRHDFVESEIGVAIETLEAAGVLTWASELVTSEYRITKRKRGTVTLTPAGRWVLYRHLRETHRVPLEVAPPAELMDHDFDALIDACEVDSPGHFNHLMREISAWVDHRGERGMAEVTLAARTTTDAAVRNIALAVLGERFGPAAEPAVRSLLDSPVARAAALVWLVDHEHEPPVALLDPDPPVFVDVLAIVLASRGSVDMVDVFEHFGTHDTQLALVQQLWRLPSPAVGHVLDVLGRQHPVAGIAKAARKAKMQHASHRANQQR